MLKFESTAQVGDMIKAMDFRPMADVPDMWLTGVVVEKGPIYRGHLDGDELVKVYYCDGYTVKIVGGCSKTRDRIGDLGYIPFEVSITDFDERVSVVATAEEVQRVLTA